MTDAFKVGDKVTAMGNAGGVTYGPFSSTFDRYVMYVVKHDDGNERSYQSTDVHPTFAIGDTVKTSAGAVGRLVAGPFTSVIDDAVFWVLERDDGRHLTPAGAGLTKVVDSLATASYDDATYDLGVWYTDADGDRWRFVIRDGRVESDGTSYRVGRSLEDVASAYGPLTRVND